MNIRRFTSTTTRQAMALVRAEFGNQAIILRTRSVEGGVEIVAMADEALAGSQGAGNRSTVPTRLLGSVRRRRVGSQPRYPFAIMVLPGRLRRVGPPRGRGSSSRRLPVPGTSTSTPQERLRDDGG